MTRTRITNRPKARREALKLAGPGASVQTHFDWQRGIYIVIVRDAKKRAFMGQAESWAAAVASIGRQIDHLVRSEAPAAQIQGGAR